MIKASKNICKANVEQFIFRYFNSRTGNFTEKWTYSQMVLKNTYLTRICEKMLMEGFTFQQSWRLKASKSTDKKHFLMYFYGPFKIRYQKFVHTISLTVVFSFMFSFLLITYILFYIVSTNIITFIYFKSI